MDEKIEVLAEGRFARLVRKNNWEYVTRKNISGIVLLVPLTDAGELVLVEQFRPPVNTRVLELPAGLAGDLPGAPDEAMEQAAQRELEEETGYRAGRLTLVTKGPPSPGLCSEIIHVFLATDLQRVGAGGGDHSEDIVVHHVPLSALDAWLAGKTDVMVDPKVFMGAWFAQQSVAHH